MLNNDLLVLSKTHIDIYISKNVCWIQENPLAV